MWAWTRKRLTGPSSWHGSGRSCDICFLEWTYIMMGGAGRDPNPESFNCAGHHGLEPYDVPFTGYRCDFCGDELDKGAPAFGCRRCDCDSCLSCLQSHFPRMNTDSYSFNCGACHGLKKFVIPGDSYSCDWCEADIPRGGIALSCRQCNCDGCENCAAQDLTATSTSPGAAALNCQLHHGLELNHVPTIYGCDFCYQLVGAGSAMFSCRICNIDACVPCMWAD
ncbi:unnamed protein product, partial [Choristocarpus tenellus]